MSYPDTVTESSPTEVAASKLDDQSDLEDRCLAMGRHRWDRRLETAREKGRGSTHGAGKKLLTEAFRETCRGIEWWIQEHDGRNRNLPWIEAVGPEKASTIACKVVLDGIYTTRGFTKLVTEISDRILMELRSERLKEEAPGLYRYRLRSFRETAHYRHMRRSMNATIRYSEVDTSDLQMSQSLKVTLGTTLIDILQQATGLLKIHNVREGKKTHKVVEASSETLDWLQSRNDMLRDLYPVYLPMVVPPLRWEPGERGGYRFGLRGEMRLVRGSKIHRQDEASLDEVYQALNHIQETAWAINLRVLEVVEEVKKRDGGRAGVPSLEQIPMPPRPPEIDEDEEVRRQWRTKAHRRYNRERERQAAASEFLKTVQVARLFRDEEEIYFPANMGFRGRVYYRPEALSPQGPDLHRGLLMWAEGKRLGRDGAMWLAVHGANSIGDYGRPGLDKASYQERVDWVVANSEEIRSWAEAPLVSTGWQDCDEPWQALAWAYEWRRFLDHRARGRPDEAFMSYLPVSVDGTCNGLQHWSALTRDEDAALSVNLVPGEEAQDFYTEVLDATLDRLEDTVVRGEEPERRLAGLWLRSGLIDRTMVKRPAMTFFYGSTAWGFSQQIQEELGSRGKGYATRDFFTVERGDDAEKADLYTKACAVLAKAIEDAIGTAASGAYRGMAWVQEAVRECAKSSRKRVSWTVPTTGFRVVQHYSHDEMIRVTTSLSGQVIMPSIYVTSEDAEPDVVKQGSAAPPNYIHSLDAANLVMAVNAARTEGVGHVGVVHDSFATHAGDMTLLSRTIRQTFYQLHREPLVEILEADLRAQAGDPDDIPEPPTRGGLDLSGVLRSWYFFG